jgi:hypothetical protein
MVVGVKCRIFDSWDWGFSSGDVAKLRLLPMMLRVEMEIVGGPMARTLRVSAHSRFSTLFPRMRLRTGMQ